MSDFYALFPFLPGARRLLPPGLALDLVPEQLLASASSRLKNILSKRPDYNTVLSAREEVLQYVLMRLLVSVLGTDYYYDRFARYYAERTRRQADYLDDFLAEAGIDPEFLDVPTYMSYRHVYPETKLYHLPVKKGQVIFPRRLLPYLAGTVAYSLVRSSLPADVSDVPPHFKDYARASVPVTVSSGPSKGWGFVERLLSAEGIPDGKKRILLFWIIPYLANVKGLSVDKVVSKVQEWLSRQGGQKVLVSWVRSDAELTKKKGIRPWSLKKVEQTDPALVKMLRDMGVL